MNFFLKTGLQRITLKNLQLEEYELFFLGKCTGRGFFNMG
jgi:hypothetical protein